MSLPYNTFTQSVAHMERLTAAKVTTADLGAFYNNAYRHLVQSDQWTARVGETVVNTINPYSTGTVAATITSNVITGTGTTWTSTHECGFIRINNEDAYYKIAAVNSATALTIEVPWPYASVTGASYEIFGLYYALPTKAARVLSPLHGSGTPIHPRSLPWVQHADPARRSSGSTALAYIPHGIDASGLFLIEFWPRYSSAESVRVFYEKRIDDLSGNEVPIIRNDVIEAQAMAYAFSLMYAKFGNDEYSKLALSWESKAGKLLEEALREDQERHNLPDAVQDEEGLHLGWDFYVSHDV